MLAQISSQTNPYVIGRPIYEGEMFFGRIDLFQFIKDNLIQGSQVILLHGQRRIGKSSVLAQIPNHVRLNDFMFISLSLEGQAQKKIGDLLSALARDIVDQIEELVSAEVQIPYPRKSAFRDSPQEFGESFLPQVYKALEGKKLVLLIDEFDVLAYHNSDAAVEHFFPYIQSILSKHPNLYLLPVVGRRLDDLPNLLELFASAPYQEVGLLKEKDAKTLITQPAEKYLEYEPDAITLILKLTAGHPYFTQVLCFSIFAFLREEERNRVTSDDVTVCLDKAIELGQAGLKWFHDGLSVPEQVVFSAIAKAQEDGLKKSFWETLEEYGGIKTERLSTAEGQLLDWCFISKGPYEKGNPITKVKVELVRRWLLERHPLRQEVKSYRPNKKELVNLLKKGVGSWNRWKERNSNLRIDLSKSDLSKLDLIGVELSEVNLSKVNLSSASLSKADLSKSDLSEANLSSTDLTKADLSMSDLRNATLNRANLKMANVNRANLSMANLIDSDLSMLQALGTNFTEAKLTGICIEDWNINNVTEFENAFCEYVYLKGFNQERRPRDGIFQLGEFAVLCQQVVGTVDFIFGDGIDWQAFSKAFQDVRRQFTDQDIAIQGIERKSDGAFVVRLEVAEDIDKLAIESAVKQLYESQLNILESQYKRLLHIQGAQLEEIKTVLDSERMERARLSNIIGKVASEQAVPKYDMRNAQFAGGFAETVQGNQIGGIGVINNYGTSTEDITRLLTALREQAQTFPIDQKDEALDTLDDLENDLAKPDPNQARIGRRLKKLVALAAAVGTLASEAAAVSGDLKTFTTNLIELTESLGIPIEQVQITPTKLP